MDFGDKMEFLATDEGQVVGSLGALAATAFGGPVAGAAAAGVLAYSQANAQNEALARAAQSTRQAQKAAAQQTAEHFAVRRNERLREVERLRGSVRVALARQGGDGGVLDRQIDYDALFNDQILRRNEAASQRAIRRGAQGDLLALESERANPILAAMFGGLSGFSTGLQIEDSLNTLTKPKTGGTANEPPTT